MNRQITVATAKGGVTLVDGSVRREQFLFLLRRENRASGRDERLGGLSGFMIGDLADDADAPILDDVAGLSSATVAGSGLDVADLLPGIRVWFRGGYFHWYSIVDWDDASDGSHRPIRGRERVEGGGEGSG
jgi:hypothetical protein